MNTDFVTVKREVLEHPGANSSVMVDALIAWASDLERGMQVCIPASSLRKIASALCAPQPAPQPAQQMAWTPRELELIDEMIENYQSHANQCDGIANRRMAEKQKGWDMERVALLRKVREMADTKQSNNRETK